MHPIDHAYTYNTRRKILSSKQHKLLNSTKRSASAKGLKHNITINDIVIPQFCPVLGVEMNEEGTKNNAPSVDRIDSSKGYIKGNVRVISMRANRLKNNATLDELKAIVEYVEREQLK